MNAVNEKTILITGCSSGIGYHTAMILRERGHRVIASARKKEDVARLQHEGLTALQLDLNNSVSIASAVEQLLNMTEGRCDALFNNAAFGQPGAVEDLSRETLRFQFETNVFGTQELTNLLIPLMRRQGHGRLIYNSSILGLVAMRYRGAYNASKYAIEGLADTLRLELHGSGIQVALIEPGPITSDFRKNALKLYRSHIDAENSVHRSAYQAVEERLQKEGDVAPFTLPAQAVTDKVIHALEAKRARAHYPVTLPAYGFALLKRLLPTVLLDVLLRKV